MTQMTQRKEFKVRAFQGSHRLPDYKVIVNDGELEIYQPIRNKWISVGCRPADVIQDKLFIDLGQDWYITGIRKHYIPDGYWACCGGLHLEDSRCPICGDTEV